MQRQGESGEARQRSQDSGMLQVWHSNVRMERCMRTLATVLTLLLAAAPAVAKSNETLTVHLKNSAGEDAGTAKFKQLKDGRLEIKLSLKNIYFGEHAVHIHENPVCDAPDFHGAGGHFNPAGKQHGYDNPMGHHNGDLPGNIMIDENHMGEATF